MLVLTQKEGEVLQLGDDIRIYIKRMKGNMVRLCIDAPREILIVRVPATPKRRPLNRPTTEPDDLGTDSAGLDLRPPGEALAQGDGDYPVPAESPDVDPDDPSETGDAGPDAFAESTDAGPEDEADSPANEDDTD
jgi:carbon storage regulator